MLRIGTTAMSRQGPIRRSISVTSAALKARPCVAFQSRKNRMLTSTLAWSCNAMQASATPGTA